VTSAASPIGKKVVENMHQGMAQKGIAEHLHRRVFRYAGFAFVDFQVHSSSRYLDLNRIFVSTQGHLQWGMCCGAGQTPRRLSKMENEAERHNHCTMRRVDRR